MTQQIPSLLILVLLLFRLSAASNNYDGEITPESGPAPEPEPDNPDRRNYNRQDELIDIMRGQTRRYYLELDGPVDSNIATMFLVDYLLSLRDDQCTTCVDALRIYSAEEGEMTEEILDVTYPKVNRKIAGIKPVVVRLAF